MPRYIFYKIITYCNSIPVLMLLFLNWYSNNQQKNSQKLDNTGPITGDFMSQLKMSGTLSTK